MDYVELLEPLAPQIQSDVRNAMWSSKVVVKCTCGQANEVGARSLVRKWAAKGHYLCKSCHVKTYVNDPEKIRKQKESYKAGLTPERRKKLSESGHKAWAKPGFRERISAATTQYNKEHPERQKAGTAALTAWVIEHPEHLDKIREKADETIKKKWEEDPEYRVTVIDRMKHALDKPESKEKHRLATIRTSTERWEDPEYRTNQAAIQASPEYLESARNKSKELWKDPLYRANQITFRASPEYRAAQSKKSKEVLSRPEVREKLAAARAKQGESSKCEDQLCEMLDEIGIKYERWKKIGWYTFDVYIPNPGKRTLLLEMNGHYWHSLPQVVARDMQKLAYINDYLSYLYEVRYVWDYELGQKDKVIRNVRRWLGQPEENAVNFDLKDITLRTVSKDEARNFLEKYHYLSGVGRYGHYIGAYFGDNLVGITVISSMLKETAPKYEQIKMRGMRELLRFCIHPDYLRPDFAAWFLSRTVEMFRIDNKDVKLLISYADREQDRVPLETAGWKFAESVEPFAWYVDAEGYVMHEHTFHRKAKGVKMTEDEFAEVLGCQRVKDQGRSRYILHLGENDADDQSQPHSDH